MNPILEKPIETKDEFTTFKNEFGAEHKLPEIFAIGKPFYDEKKELLAVKYLSINVNTNYGFIAAVMHFCKKQQFTEPTAFIVNREVKQKIFRTYFGPFQGENGHRNIDTFLNTDPYGQNDRVIMVYPTREDLQKKAETIADADCRLALLSNRDFKPNTINLDGIFGLLPIRYFTSASVYTREMWQKKFLVGNMEHLVTVDKFPPMWWGTMIPEGVRIADTSRVRQGAYLGTGTTVMHEGFVNFNAGTEAGAMVEGRISAGVEVGPDSDIGGGASIMGTLSGGGKEVIKIGSNCLIGANGGTGISLGDRCTIEAGLYITAGMPIELVDDEFDVVSIKNKFQLHKKGFDEEQGELLSPNFFVKAKELSGQSDMLFRRDSDTGRVGLYKNKKPNKLNAILHAAVPVGDKKD